MRPVHRPRAALAIVVLTTVAGLATTAIEAQDGIVVGGRVLGPDGAPLAGSAVALHALGADADAVSTAVADDRGRYRLEAPSAGTWRVVAGGPGLVAREFRLLPLVRTTTLPDARLDLDAGLAVRVEGADGKPLAGADVSLAPGEGSRARFGMPVATWEVPVRRGVSDADGAVRLPKAAGARESLRVSAAGLAPAVRDRVGGDAAAVRLEAGRRRDLLVTDAGDVPVPGARVALRGGHALGTTGADGRLALALPARDGLDVVVSGAGGVAVAVRVDAAAPDAPRRVSLPATRLVPGRVLDAATRKAVEGAVVWIESAPDEAVRTDRGGGFVVAAAVGGDAVLNAAAPRYLRADPWRLAVVDDGRPGPAIPLTPGATVEGKVVDEDGAPLEGARLRVEPKPAGGGMMRIEISSSGGRDPQVVSDADGRFVVGPIDPGSPWVLKAEADGRAPGSADLAGLEPLRTRTGVRIVVPRGGAVAGRVVDGEGAPIADAEVALEAGPPGPGAGGFRVLRPGDDAPPRSAASGRDGRFRIEGVVAGTYVLRATRAGFAPATRGGIAVEVGGRAADVGDVAMEPGVSVWGRVVDEAGAPIEGVAVQAREAGGGGMMFVLEGASLEEEDPDAITGIDGAFEIRDLAPGRPVSLSFAREGYLGKSEAEVPVPTAEPLEVVLQPSSVLAGTVVDPEGKPVPGASVNLTRTVNAAMGNRMFAAITREDRPTDGDGRFRFEGQRPGAVTLEASASGLRDATLDGVEIRRGEDLLDVEIRLEPGAVVVGRVTAPDGRPVSGARVAEVGSGEGGGMIAMPGDGAASDGDGYYRLEGLEPGTRSIEVTHASYARTVRDLDADPGVNVLDFEFEGGSAVRGSVVDADGAGIPAAWVQLVPAGQHWGGPEATTDDDGLFEIPGVADGEYDVRASAEGFATRAGDDRVRVEGAPVDGVTVRLAAGAVIAGRIVGVEPDRLAEVEIEAFGGDGGEFASGRADASGEYRVEGAGPGTWRVEGRLARAGRNASAEVRIEPGATEGRVDLDFGKGVSLSGRATLAGRPFADAVVSASGIDVAASGLGRTDRDGAFRVEGLEAGRYRLDLRQWATGIAHVREVDVAGDTEVEVELPVARIAGRVRDAADRRALSGARLALEPLEGAAPIPGFGPGAISDLEGSFRIENVPDGTWRLTARRDGYAAAEREVVVREGGDVTDVDLRLDPTEGLALAVRTPQGRAPDTVTVAVLDGGGRAVEQGQFATGEGGVVRLSRVPPGAWEVLLHAPGTGTARVAATAPGPAIEVRLPEACRVAVRVPELEGSTAYATVRLADPSGAVFRRLSWFGGVEPDVRFTGGRVEIDRVPPGAWTVAVTAADGRTWTAPVSASPATVVPVVLE